MRIVEIVVRCCLLVLCVCRAGVVFESQSQFEVTDNLVVQGEKYVFVDGWFGRFANNVNMLINALEIAKRLNRTLLVLDMSSQGIVFSDVFDFSTIREMGYRLMFVSDGFTHQFGSLELCRNIGPNLEQFVDAHVQTQDPLLGLSPETPFYKCIGTELSQKMYSALKPTKKYQDGIHKIWEEFLHTPSGEPVLGVHLRKLEDFCFKASERFLPSSIPKVKRMCSLDWTLVQEILSEIDTQSHFAKIFVASDGEDPERDAVFKNQSQVVMLDWSSRFIKRLGLSNVDVDFFMLQNVDFFVGNPVSSFASLVSMMRVASTGINREILSWPLIQKDWTESAFWRCDRFQYFCAQDRTNDFPLC